MIEELIKEYHLLKQDKENYNRLLKLLIDEHGLLNRAGAALLNELIDKFETREEAIEVLPKLLKFDKQYLECLIVVAG